MHRHRVAVDSGLSNYQTFLKDEGYEVIDLTKDSWEGAEAIILTGLDQDLNGITNRASDAFVMDVSGRQPEEVLYDLRKHFARKEERP
ncbi:MAG: YkuS family protein [Bacteroidota bacterium]